MIFSKYDKWGDYHWKLYEREENSSYKEHVNFIKEWVKGENILDIGAGDGLITHLLNARGVDDNETAVSIAQKKGVDVVLGSAYDLPFQKEFKTVFMGDVIEHLEFPERAILEVKKVLKNKGVLYITTPHLASNGILTDKFHYKEYTTLELKDFIEGFGFKLLEPIKMISGKLYAKFSLDS